MVVVVVEACVYKVQKVETLAWVNFVFVRSIQVFMVKREDVLMQSGKVVELEK